MLLVDIARQLLDRGIAARFVIVGEHRRLPKDAYRAYSEELIKRIGESHLECSFDFVGAVEPEQVGEALRRSDIAVFPAVGNRTVRRF